MMNHDELWTWGQHRLEAYHQLRQTRPDIPRESLIPSSAAFNPSHCPQSHYFYQSRMDIREHHVATADRTLERREESLRLVQHRLDAAEKLRREAQALMKENSQLRQTICDQAQHFVLIERQLQDRQSIVPK